MWHFSLLGLVLAQSAAPQDPGFVPPNRWTVDYGTMSCSLARRLAGEGSPIIVLNQPQGLEPGTLVVMDGGTGLDARLRGMLEVRVDGGDPISAQSRRERRDGR